MKSSAVLRGTSQVEQNETHSLLHQDALSNAHRYNNWLVDTVRDAWQGSTRVLDIGCSIGNITKLISDRLQDAGQPDALVVGVEVIPEAARRFNERFAHRPDMRVVSGDITQPIPELGDLGPFDAAVSFNVIEHIEDDVGALRAIASHLKPSGRVGILVPGGGSRLYGSLDAMAGHYRRYTPMRVRHLLDAADFDVVSVRRVNMVGAVLWFLKYRVGRSVEFQTGEVKWFDRIVPTVRMLDSLCGPPFGQSVAAVGRLRAP
jgi:SAM-dependent methyltransferase